MTPPEHFLAALGVVLFFGLLLPQLFRPLQLPFTTSLILAGSLLGPNGFGYVTPDDSLVLFGFMGAMFQMLIAGAESQTLSTGTNGGAVARLTLLNGVVPAGVGVAIARAFDYDWTASLFVGIVFLSSSIMLVFGMVEKAGIRHTAAGKLAKGTAVVEDLGASVLAFLLFQTLQPHVRFPLPILAGLLLASVILLRMFLPEVVAFFFGRFREGEDEHEGRLRLIVALLLLVIFAYSTLDVHPVIAAFLVGFALAEIPEAVDLRARLDALGYGLFIPVFLFVVGIETDFKMLWSFDPANAIGVAILVGAIGTKLIGGFMGGRWVGLARHDATIVALSSTAKLTVPLSATYAARDLGILPAELFSAIVIVAVVTSLLAPISLALARWGTKQEAAKDPTDG